MSLQKLIDASYETFTTYALDTNLVLLHPRSQYRSVLVAMMLQSPSINSLYYAMGADDLNLQSFISGMIHDLSNQHPTFGRHLNLLPNTVYDNCADFDVIVETFAADLGEVSDDAFLFILDEYDRTDTADDIQLFIERLVDLLPEQCTMVLNSRTLPRLPWVSMVAKRKAILLEDDILIDTNFYEVTEQGENNLDVYSLGPGFVMLNDQSIDTWEGHLPRLLFFFALDKSIVTRSEICQAFWPDLDNDQAVNVFHVTKRRLHKALDMDVLVHDDGYYRVNPDFGVRYDAMEFVTTLMVGRNTALDTKERMKAWQNVIKMYHGPYLQGHTDDWITRRRYDYQTGYLEALTMMADVRLRDGRREHALSLYQKAASEDITRQDLHRKIMSLFASMGRRSEAAAHFKMIGESIDVLEEETQSMYSEIMS